MDVDISGDYDFESGLGKVLSGLTGTGYRRFFLEKDYGKSINIIAVGLVCQDPRLNLKSKIRMSKKDKALYVDIVCDLTEFKKMTLDEKGKLVVKLLLGEIPSIILKYKFNDFNLNQFNSDLRKLFNNAKFIE